MQIGFKRIKAVSSQKVPRLGATLWLWYFRGYWDNRCCRMLISSSCIAKCCRLLSRHSAKMLCVAYANLVVFSHS